MFLHCLVFSFFLSYGVTLPTQQQPLIAGFPDEQSTTPSQDVVRSQGLHGRFLHITDFHPDLFYQIYSSTEEEAVCHRGDGPAGIFGAETTDCDSPISLVNATFKWINDHLKNKIDFIIWTGDSARHDEDEDIPRTEEEIIKTNELLVHKFEEVFGKEDDDDTDPTNDLTIPIVPNFGNNDIMPHNIMEPGPNKWTQRYLSIWRKLIPEEQRHAFSTGGWFSVEVIPNHLTVFSLNTMYFFEHNTAVDGCAERSEPGYQQMEWLRIQLQFIRNRGMKAMLIGHVPPARTEAKLLWDETCWQKYTLWLQQYRDVVVGSLYGHMNIDHFLIQDNKDISNKALKGNAGSASRMALDDELTIQSTADYLTELRSGWSQIPDAPKTKSKSETGLGYFHDLFEGIARRKKPRKTKEDKFLEKIGGEWAERYSVSLISPSIVPNYFPTMRVFEYNISGLENLPVAHANRLSNTRLQRAEEDEEDEEDEADEEEEETPTQTEKKKAKKGKGKKKRPKKPNFKTPKPPSKSAPPGPAYSPQTLSLLGYKQYYANLTQINNDFEHDQPVREDRWHNGKHSGKKPHKDDKSRHHNKFQFEIEYDTRNDSVFGLKDLTVRSYLDLAGRIGQYKPPKGDRIGDVDTEDSNDGAEAVACEETRELAASSRKKHKKHGKKHKHRKAINRVWFTFVGRAFVGTREDDELHDEFGQVV